VVYVDFASPVPGFAIKNIPE